MATLSRNADGGRDAATRRAAMLARLKAMADDGHGRDALPLLIRSAMDDTAVLHMHLWLVDQALFDAGRTLALRHIERAARWCGTGMDRPALATVGWLLDARTGGARLSAWLLAVGLDAGFELTGPDPYR